MKFFRIPVLLTVGALLLAACQRDSEPAAAEAAANPLLAYVPAETPYLFANLEPTPVEVVDTYLARFAPSLGMAQALFDDIQIGINDPDSGHGHARLVAAIMNELDGKLNREGIESLGFSLESHKAIYGMGAFPVVRIALKDADALRAAIGRIEAESGMTFPTAGEPGAEYWRVADGNAPAALYLAILGDHVAMGMFPTAAEGEFLPAFLGQAMPENALAAGKSLAVFNREKGFSAYGSGYLDLRRIADEFLDGNSTTMRHLEGMHQSQHGLLDPVCVAEVRSMIAQAPRMAIGTTELTANVISMKFQLELDPTLAGDLADLVADVPVADESTGKLFAASLALQAGRLKEFALNRATALAEAPFQCARLAHVNKAAGEALTQLNRPMPPFIGNLNGFRIGLDEVDLANPSPESARGMFALEVEKPQMLVGMAQMFIPGVDELGLEPGGDPVELPQELMSVAVEGMHVFAAMSKDSIGVALGADQQPGLADFMEASGDNGGTFFSMSYDMAAHMEMQGRMRDRMMQGAGDDHAENPELQEMMHKLQELEASYSDMLGRARFDLRFTPQGLEIENRMTFR